MYTLFPRAIGGRNFLNIYFLYLSMLRYCLITIGLNQCLINKLSKATNLLRWLLRRGSPLPIPNRVVKPACADGTAICGRVCRRLSFEKPCSNERGFLFLQERRVPRRRWSVRRISFENPIQIGQVFCFMTFWEIS